ncbi:MAG: LCP family protein [Caldilineaceae bacterium]|nr:LCP family protein [Caldilineaceae bacterium]
MLEPLSFPPQPNRSGRRIIVGRMLAAVLFALTACVPVVWASVASAAPGPEDAAPVAPPYDETVNILILGADREPGVANWRTDVMMLVALDLKRGEAGVISFPRDIYLEEIPNHQPNRMNVVDYLGETDEAGGGPELLGAIIEEKMGIPVDHYVRFDFSSFQEVVDALGGVDVEVDCPFTGYLRDYGGYLKLEPGMHHLNGDQALIYVRDRALSGGDLDRARRQQRFVWSVRNQLVSKEMIRRLPALYSALSDSVETDLGLINTMRIARAGLDMGPDDIHGFVIAPPDMLTEGWRNGMSIFIADWDLIGDQATQLFDQPSFDLTNTPDWCE